jgi:hypothetical protein
MWLRTATQMRELSRGCVTFLALMAGFLVLCMLSRASTDASPQGRFGVAAVRSTVRDLLRASERALATAGQDGLAFLALDHAIEARVLAQTAGALGLKHGLDAALAREAADAAASAQQREGELVDYLSEHLAGDGSTSSAA